MRVDCALLCDASTTREGLLNILAGGITRLNAAAYPHPHSGALAIRILLHRTEADAQHKMQIVLQSEDGQRLVQIDAEFAAGAPPDLQPGEDLSIPLSIAFNGQIPQEGRYSFEILIDGLHQASVPFRAMPPPTEKGAE